MVSVAGSSLARAVAGLSLPGLVFRLCNLERIPPAGQEQEEWEEEEAGEEEEE